METPLMHAVEPAAARLGIGRSVMYRLIASGDIPTVKVGKRRLVPEAELVAYVGRLRDGSAA
jgi:excisionase family DNA binding protein